MEVVCAVMAEEVTDRPLSIHSLVRYANGKAPAKADLHIAVVLRSDPSDYGAVRRLSFRIIDDDGKVILPEGRPLELYTANPPPVPDWFHEVPVHLIGVDLPRHGRYEIEVLLDGRKLQYIAFHFQESM